MLLLLLLCCSVLGCEQGEHPSSLDLSMPDVCLQRSLANSKPAQNEPCTEAATEQSSMYGLTSMPGLSGSGMNRYSTPSKQLKPGRPELQRVLAEEELEEKCDSSLQPPVLLSKLRFKQEPNLSGQGLRRTKTARAMAQCSAARQHMSNHLADRSFEDL